MDPFELSPRDVQLRRDLLGDGWSDRSITRAVKSGDLVRLRHGAYASRAVVDDLDEIGRHRLLSRAVMRTAMPGSVLSHASAAAEYGINLWGFDLTKVHLTRADQRAGRRESGVIQHRARLSDADWKLRDGVRVMNLDRAVLEVIVTHDAEVGLVTTCSALSSGLVSMSDLRAVEPQTNRWPNSLGVRMVLARADPRMESIAEFRTWHLFHEQHVPLPIPQVEVYDERGTLIGRVDFAWPGLGVFLEFDGRVKYEKFRRKGESLGDYLMREKRREEDICRVTGWVCIRIQWADLETPVHTGRRIMQLLGSRSSAVA